MNSSLRVLSVLALLCASTVTLAAQRASAPAPTCRSLAALAKQADPRIIGATAMLIPASKKDASYCKVTLSIPPAINIAVGLPLSSVDGGTGSEQGAWNGRVENMGGGGYGGTLSMQGASLFHDLTEATSKGYVGSFTDTGHSIEWCNAVNPETGKTNAQPFCGNRDLPAGYSGGFALDPRNRLNKEQIIDFIDESLKAQVTSALMLTKLYYGKNADRNYWNGCSTGGRQGMDLAQRHGELFDGILAGDPAMNWNRFIIGGVWPSVVVHELIGPAGIDPKKTEAANQAAIAACDANDGVVDGVINEPRRCAFDAKSLVCKQGTSEPAGCLTPIEAKVINAIWDGPRNQRGQRLWGGITKGTTFNVLLYQGLPPAVTPPGVPGLMQTFVASWLYQDPRFPTLDKITMENFATAFQLSDRKFAESSSTSEYVVSAATDSTNLDVLKRRGAKLILYHGWSDPLIVPFGSVSYTSGVFTRYGVKETQSFMRTFLYPGAGHCSGSAPKGPVMNNDDLFAALVDWVEHGNAPDYIVASNNLNKAQATVSRKICKYPDELRYGGTGDKADEKSYRCVVAKEEPADLKAESQVASRYSEAP